MFEAFYKLGTNPFRLTPDPKFCFRHPSHNQAYAYLQYALRLGEGFILVTGRPGIGKTTLAEVFLTEIKHSEVVAARVASANVEAADLLRVVAFSYGIDVAGLDKATILLYLEQFFVQQARAGKRVLLIIDEAQGLPHTALEELRLLADLQRDSRPLLQMFLVGQEKLRDLMREPDMEQFQQRVIGACHLEPLDLSETKSYIQHRLRKAGWKGDPELSGAAVHALYQYSKGVPRHVNKICTRLLLHGMLEEKHELHKEDVLTVADELRAEQLAPLEHDDAVSADAVSVSELESDSQLIEGLALRADPDQPEDEQEEADDLRATAAEVTDPVDTLQHPQDAELAAVSNVPGTARIPPQKGSWGAASTDRPDFGHQRGRQRFSGVGEFPGQPHRRPRQATASVSSAAAAPRVRPQPARRKVKSLLARSDSWRSLMSALSVILSQYAEETLRKFGGLKWKGKLAVLVGVLLVFNVITAMLMRHLLEDNGAQKSMLVGYPQSMQESLAGEQPQTSSAPTEGPEHNEAVNPGTDTAVAAQENSSVSIRTAVVTEQESGGGQDDGPAAKVNSPAREEVIVNPRGIMPEQSVSGVTEPPVQETVPVVSGSDGVTVEPVAATSAAMQRDVPEKVGIQTRADDNDSSGIPASMPPGPQDVPVLSQDKANPGNEAQNAESGNLVDTATSGATPEVLAKAPPSLVAEEKAVTVPVTRQEKIAELLSRGHESLKRDRLLIPTHDSAYKYYQQTLILDPGNDEAVFGIERIVARYITLARQALKKQDKKKGRRYIERGLSINPADKRLLAMQDSLNTPVVAELQAEVERRVVQVETQVPVAEAEPQAQNFVSRLKAFFTRGRSTGNSNEVVVEER